MAVIKVFDSKGVKSVELMGNVSEQEYDPEFVPDIEDENNSAPDDSEADE